MKYPRRLTTERLVGLSPKEINFVIEFCKDFSPRRAAEASGYSPDSGYQLREKPEIDAAIDSVLQSRLDASHVDAEWLLGELVDNHMIARATGKLSASNTALGLIGKMGMVDAFAAEKVLVAGDQEVMDRLQRARQRVGTPPAASPDGSDNEVSFL